MRVCLTCGHRFDSNNWTCDKCGYRPEYVAGHIAFAPELAKNNNGYAPKYFEQVDGCIENSFWIKARKNLFLWAMRKYFPLADSFLEIGCATGLNISHFREAFPKLKISGFELFTEGLSFVRNRISDAFIFQADARRIPFDKEFDVIGAFDVLEHVEQDTVVLGQMYQATRPGGGILVSVPQHPLLWSQRDEYLLHKRRYTRKEMVEKVRKAGFKIVRTTSFISLLFAGMIWDSLKNRRPNRNYNPLAEVQVGSATNATLTLFLSLERHLIKLGMSFPVGGSLFLVAKRI